MRRTLLAIVFMLLPSCLVPSVADAFTNGQAKIAVHLRPLQSKNICAAAPLPPCNPEQAHLSVSGYTLTPYTAYVLVLDGDPTFGVAGAAFGISYGDSLNVGAWQLCADLQFPGGPYGVSWPGAGSGNIITWQPESNCQQTPAVGDLDGRVTAVIGAFYVYAYGSDVLQITQREYVPQPDFQVADCAGTLTNLLYPAHAGRVGFGSATGVDPCLEASEPDTTDVSGRESSETLEEVIIRFVPNAVQVPTSGEVPLSQATFHSARMGALLATGGVQSIRKAFPEIGPGISWGRTRGGAPARTADRSEVYVLRVNRGTDTAALVRRLNEMPEVVYAEENGYTVPAVQEVFPNDPYFQTGLQWNLHNIGQFYNVPDADIDAPAAWGVTTGDSAILLGLVDYGAREGHPELIGKINALPSSGTDHGTAAAGIMAALTNTDPPNLIAGVNWLSPIHQEEIPYGTFDYTEVADAIHGALDAGCDVINGSFSTTDAGLVPKYSLTVRLAVADAYRQNRAYVAGAGNENVQHPEYVNFPAAFGGVIAVGASDWNDQVADFSNRGPHIDLCAPGVHVHSLSMLSTSVYNGTSFAAPHVTAVAGLLLAVRPDLDHDDVAGILRASADDLPPIGFDDASGAGRLNAFSALRRLGGPWVLERLPGVQGGTDLGASARYSMSIYAVSGLADGRWYVRRHEVRRDVSFAAAFEEPPAVWGRGLATTGWNDESPNVAIGWCEPVAGSITTTGCTLRTYVYEVFDVLSEPQGWYPASPSNAVFAWTALGSTVPLGIEGDGARTHGQVVVAQNPASRTTMLSFEIKTGGPTSLLIFDLQGRKVRTLLSDVLPAGGHSVRWDLATDGGEHVAAGVYFYQLTSTTGRTSGRLVVVE